MRALFRKSLIAAVLVPLAPFAQAQEAPACPDLRPYYEPADGSWPNLVFRLIQLQPQCLRSAEYYALLGAAQLNTGNLEPALEALERALLLDPMHGGAAVDFAQALYLDGQLFPALELNAQLLQREDVPPQLAALLQQRQAMWDAQTRSRGFSAEFALGHDNNLNGAPLRGDFTLTLAGETVQLELDDEFRPVSGPYANLRLGGSYQWLRPSRTHDLVFGIRNRQSQLSEAELLQGDVHYMLGIRQRHFRWDLIAGTTHLQYGGSPLFTASDMRARVRREGDGCQPLVELAMQHQLYHQQSFMAGLESSLSGGVECNSGEGDARFSVEAGAVHNQALKAARPGADRDGWVLRLLWQRALGAGFIRGQYSLAHLQDANGYSALLANGAAREIYSRQFRAQYLRPLKQDLTLQINVSHQRQGSNLAPFENRGTAFDVGLMLGF